MSGTKRSTVVGCAVMGNGVLLIGMESADDRRGWLGRRTGRGFHHHDD